MKKGISSKLKGFSLMELLVCIAIAAVLAALLFPAYVKVTAGAKKSQCVSNQKAIVTGILLYAGENDGRLPAYGKFVSPTAVDSGNYWWEVVKPYLKTPGDTTYGIGYNFLRCPAAAPLPKVSTTIGVHYAELAGNAPFGFDGLRFPGSKKLSQVSSGTVLTADILNADGQMWFLSPNEYPPNKDTDKDGILDTREGSSFVFRHGNNTVVALADGSAKVLSKAEWGLNEGNLWGRPR